MIVRKLYCNLSWTISPKDFKYMLCYQRIERKDGNIDINRDMTSDWIILTTFTIYTFGIAWLIVRNLIYCRSPLWFLSLMQRVEWAARPQTESDFIWKLKENSQSEKWQIFWDYLKAVWSQTIRSNKLTSTDSPLILSITKIIWFIKFRLWGFGALVMTTRCCSHG